MSQMGLLFGCAAVLLCGSVLLAGAEEAGPAEVVVLNKGIGGHSSADGLRRFERDVAAVKPAHLVLYFGMNDSLNSGKLVPPEEFRRNLLAMIDRAKAAGVRTIILVTPNPIVEEYVRERHPTHPEPDLQAHLARFDAVVREVARERELPLADLRKLVAERGGATKEAACLIRNEANARSRDGVHPTAECYRLMAGLIEPLLRGRVRPGDTVVCFGDSITYGSHMPGAGTATGDTYPAWLWLMLNRMVGRAVGERPPAAR